MFNVTSTQTGHTVKSCRERKMGHKLEDSLGAIMHISINTLTQNGFKKHKLAYNTVNNEQQNILVKPMQQPTIQPP